MRTGDPVERAFVGKAGGLEGLSACASCPAWELGWGGRGMVRGAREKGRGGQSCCAGSRRRGRGAAAGFLAPRTDAIGAPEKVSLQPGTGPGAGEWDQARGARPSPRRRTSTKPKPSERGPLRLWAARQSPPRGRPEVPGSRSRAPQSEPLSRTGVLRAVSFLESGGPTPTQPLLDHWTQLSPSPPS